VKLKARTYRFIHLISALAIISGLYLGYTIYCSNYIGVYNGLRDRVGYNAVVDNYEEAVEIAADEFDLPYGYLMALIQLECGGNIPAGSRFERHVFRRLKNVRDGKRNRYENVTAKHLSGASDEALRNLATSWGPFQLMGYKCILLDVKVKDIRGENGIHYGAEWINRTYGNRLRKEEYKDCFHIHNTGKPYPKVGSPTTHDPKYVQRGLAAIKKHEDARQ
jgi:hypothetical protein|tara:strand:- start:217 stop:879 length:663 start_codon:yes stop_codon:yes gene_type:complete